MKVTKVSCQGCGKIVEVPELIAKTDAVKLCPECWDTTDDFDDARIE